MGFHVCEYCQDETSSGDVIMQFASGRTWQMPDMILHYVVNHDYRPPIEFMEDVFNSQLTDTSRYQTKSAEQPTKVGYLEGKFDTWGWGDREDKAGFFLELWRLVRQASNSGKRVQTRSITA